MSYGFRVRFKLPPTALFSLTLEGERLDLESDVLGSAVWLKSMTPDVPLKDAEGVALRGEGFESEEIAQSQGERWLDALQASLARLGTIPFS
ncbi:MAG TPA: hypothetical protein VIM10_01560 [Actinopolymorphaceae bacterium]|jgi:hypothetical protein